MLPGGQRKEGSSRRGFVKRFLCGFRSFFCFMGKSLLLLLCFVMIFPGLRATAQSSSVAPNINWGDNPPLDGNYVLTLSRADGKGEDISMLVASELFSTFNSKVTFNAKLIQQHDGSFLLFFTLTQGDIITKSTVVLRPGEPVQLVRNGEQFYNLRLDRYNAAPAKAAPAAAANH